MWKCMLGFRKSAERAPNILCKGNYAFACGLTKLTDESVGFGSRKCTESMAETLAPVSLGSIKNIGF